MSTLTLIMRELIGLFIDDGSLAISIIVVVIFTVMSAGVGAPAIVTGGVLLFGCMIALLDNISRTIRKD